MTQETVAPRQPGRGVLVWAVTATLAAILFGSMALLLWLRQGIEKVATHDRVTTTPPVSTPRRSNRAEAAPTAGAFDQLKEEEVAGRYRFFDAGAELGIITLLPNHSIINKDGTTYPRYRWEIQTDGLLTVWQRGEVLLNVMEQPGVYVSVKKDGTESLRVEKLQE
jgi:hypothetical protein